MSWADLPVRALAWVGAALSMLAGGAVFWALARRSAVPRGPAVPPSVAHQQAVQDAAERAAVREAEQALLDADADLQAAAGVDVDPDERAQNLAELVNRRRR